MKLITELNKKLLETDIIDMKTRARLSDREAQERSQAHETSMFKLGDIVSVNTPEGNVRGIIQCFYNAPPSNEYTMGQDNMMMINGDIYFAVTDEQGYSILEENMKVIVSSKFGNFETFIKSPVKASLCKLVSRPEKIDQLVRVNRADLSYNLMNQYTSLKRA